MSDPISEAGTDVLGGGEQGERDDREAQLDEVVPDARDDHGPGDIGSGEPPRRVHGIGDAHPERPAGREGVGDGGGCLVGDGGLRVGEAGEHRGQHQPVGHQIPQSDEEQRGHLEAAHRPGSCPTHRRSWRCGASPPGRCRRRRRATPWPGSTASHGSCRASPLADPSCSVSSGRCSLVRSIPPDSVRLLGHATLSSPGESRQWWSDRRSHGATHFGPPNLGRHHGGLLTHDP